MNSEWEEHEHLPSIDDVLRDPAASRWLRDALSTALTRDPVDAANDAEVLAKLLDRRYRLLLGGEVSPESPGVNRQ